LIEAFAEAQEPQAMKGTWPVVFLAAVTAAWGAPSLWGYTEFKEQFEKKYVKDLADPAITPQEKLLAEGVKEAYCGVCHTGERGKNKKVRNNYGAALGKLITKADKQAAKKIQDAFDTVAAEKSDPNDPISPTFGELIKQGKLPGKQDKKAPPAEAK
jgi:hypothetical protein